MYVTLNEMGINGFRKINDGNIVMYSSVKNYEANLAFNNFGIKYVMSGKETYTLRDEVFNLKAGQYVLCNQHCEGRVAIDNKENAEGICIDIRNDLLAEVLINFKNPSALENDIDLDTYFLAQNFIENKFENNSTKLGSLLNQLHGTLEVNPYDNYQFSSDFYYSLCEGIIQDHMTIVKELQAIKSIKLDTKKILWKKAQSGKQYIEQHFLEDIDIPLIAKEVNMSQYNFFRLFKEVYHVSPYQYLKQIRMDFSKTLILQHKMSISEIAIKVGFADVFSFSKAYKKHFGLAPLFDHF